MTFYNCRYVNQMYLHIDYRIPIHVKMKMLIKKLIQIIINKLI